LMMAQAKTRVYIFKIKRVAFCVLLSTLYVKTL